jgi:hypothetical protein
LSQVCDYFRGRNKFGGDIAAEIARHGAGAACAAGVAGVGLLVVIMLIVLAVIVIVRHCNASVLLGQGHRVALMVVGLHGNGGKTAHREHQQQGNQQNGFESILHSLSGSRLELIEI